MEKEPVINQYLRRMLELGGSDLHLSINFPAKARVHGNIQLLDDDVLDAPRMEVPTGDVEGHPDDGQVHGGPVEEHGEYHHKGSQDTKDPDYVLRIVNVHQPLGQERARRI